MSPTQRGPEGSISLRFHRFLLGGLILAALAAPLFAEVAIETDGQGRYVRTLVLTDVQGSHLRIWSQIRQGADPAQLLNVEGDRMGDSRPTVIEQPGTRHPWVLWSANDGHDKEIAFATWSGGRWLGPQLIERTDNSYDDMNPRLTFDSAGNPVAVWWRREPISRVYMSRFIGGEWTPATPISDPTVPARYPSVKVTGKEAVVSFFTSRGMTVLFVPLPRLSSVSVGGDGPLDGPVPPPDQRPGPSTGSGPGDGSAGGGGTGDPIRPNEQ